MDLSIENYSIQIEHFQELDEAFGLLSEQSPHQVSLDFPASYIHNVLK
jgi:hypothetical protein